MSRTSALRLLGAAAALAGVVVLQPASALPLPVQALGWGDDYHSYTQDPYAKNDPGSGRTGTGKRAGNPRPEPVALPAGVRLVQVAAGHLHTLGLTDDGRVLAWGIGRGYWLGNGTDTGRWSPTEVPVPSRVVAVSAGADHSLALGADGVLWAWGGNSKGQIGDGTRTTARRPVRVQLPAGVRIRGIAAGGLRSLAITDSGRVLQWGNLGVGEGSAPSRVPVEVPLPADADVVGVDAWAGGIAVARDGRVFAWGGVCAPAAAGLDDCRAEPHEMELPPGARVVQAAPSLLLLADGSLMDTVWRPGEGNVWQPVPLPSGAAVRAFSVSSGHRLAVTQDARLLAWGDNRQRATGVGSKARDVLVPTYVPGVDHVLQAAAGLGTSFVVRLDSGA